MTASLWQDRARLFRAVRSFFQEDDYIEVDTPILVTAPGCEVHLDYFATQWVDFRGADHQRFLRSSPELHMKQVLASGEPRIFQLAKSFRNRGERSHWHHPEFTMLEWYTVGQTFEQMIEQTLQLVTAAAEVFGQKLHGDSCLRVTVAEAFQEFAGISLQDGDPHLASKGLAAGAHSCGEDDDFETAFFKILLEKIEPQLQRAELAIVTDYPASQAALAKIEGGVAKRFELYWRGVELCNGFDELLDGEANRQRFADVIKRRQQLEMTQHQVDLEFLQAVGSGLPACCGNALGLDRLLALVRGHTSLQDSVPFWRQWPSSSSR